MNRAYSILTVKRVDDDARVIEGLATSPTPDRMGDIIEPLGAAFINPLPLLWQHDSAKPIGHAKFAKPTADGIAFKARIEKFDEPGALKDRLDEAWHTVKLGLVRAVSIGFRSLERSYIRDGGIHFLKTEILELSLVTIPANSDATISAVKSIDRAARRDRTSRLRAGRDFDPSQPRDDDGQWTDGGGGSGNGGSDGGATGGGDGGDASSAGRKEKLKEAVGGLRGAVDSLAKLEKVLGWVANYAIASASIRAVIQIIKLFPKSVPPSERRAADEEPDKDAAIVQARKTFRSALKPLRWIADNYPEHAKQVTKAIVAVNAAIAELDNAKPAPSDGKSVRRHSRQSADEHASPPPLYPAPLFGIGR